MPTIKKTNQTGKPPKKQSILDRIHRVVDKPITGIKINVYGRSGTGKTTFACTFPKPLLIAGTEDGTQSVSDVKMVDFIEVESSDTLREVIDLQSTTKKYRTIVLDTASALQDIVLKEILGIEELPAQRSWGMASRETWGQCTFQTKEILRSCLNLVAKTGCNVVIIAQEREFNTEGDGDLLMPYVGSSLSPSVTGWLNPACDYIVQTFLQESTTEKSVKIGNKVIEKLVKTGGADFCLRVAPDPVYTTKLRVPRGAKIPKSIKNPDYDTLMAIIKGRR